MNIFRALLLWLALIPVISETPYAPELEPVIKPSHIESEVVRPTLELLATHDPRINTEPAVTLMMGTAAQESDLGFYLKQHPTGPGKGPWSIEDTTHADVWRYLSRPSNKVLREAVLSLARDQSLNPHPPHSELIDNLSYSCAIARVKYWMVPETLPVDLPMLAVYWDRYFNGNPDHGTPEEFIESYEHFVTGNI